MNAFKILPLALALAFAGAAPALAADKTAAEAEVVKVTGYLTRYEIAKDGKSAVAVLLVKGKKVEIDIPDSLTIKKLKIGKIVEDDEIKCSYKVIDGKNVSVSFLRAAGC